MPLYFPRRVIYCLSLPPSSLLWTLRVGATSYKRLAIVQGGQIPERTIWSVPGLESCLRSGEHQGRLRQERALHVGITLWGQRQGHSKLDVTSQSRQHASRGRLKAVSSLLFWPRSVPIFFFAKGPQIVFSSIERSGAGGWHLSPAVMSPEKWELVFDS